MGWSWGSLLGWTLMWIFAAAPVAAQVFWKGSDRKVINDYLSVLSDFKKKTCTPRDRKRFEKYLAEYQKRGHYIPMNSGAWDVEAIKANMPLLADKLQWIRRLRKDLPSDIGRESEIRQVKEKIDRLLELKRNHRLAGAEEKEKIRRQSKQAMMEFEKHFTGFLQKIPFLLSFRHPIDHLQNRADYQEALKTEGRGDENRLLFVRKILEDGTSDRDHSERDFYLRTALDTIAVQLAKGSDFLEEDLRYDLEWVLGAISRQLEGGSARQKERLTVWEARVAEAIEFYTRVINGKVSEDVKRGFSWATYRLRDFVHRKHVETYRYFTRQPEIMRALFAYDQILLNEVGMATAENYRERKDVAQVIWNRHSHPVYSKIESSEALYRKTGKIKTADYPWLNVLFKEGEFSFTYYFMPAVFNVFCPDFYKTARETRDKNLYLALEVLKNPQVKFPALRYFSRVSMTGRIDMSRVWENHQRIHERPGRKRTHAQELEEQLKKQNYRYLYKFTSPSGILHDVVEIENEIYAVSGFPEQPVFYNYRDPHLFSFFTEIDRQPASQVSDN